MSLWEDIKSTVTEGGKVAADKAKEISDIASYKAQIAQYDATLLKQYRELGKAYFADNREEALAKYPEIAQAIADAADKKAEYEKKCADVKGVRECPSCGTSVSADHAFCPKCGAKMPEAAPVEEEFTEDLVSDFEDAAAENAAATEPAENPEV